MERRQFSILFLFLQCGYVFMQPDPRECHRGNRLSPYCMRTISSTEDFLNRFVANRDGSRMNASAIGQVGGNGEAMHINGGRVQLATYDRCEPRYVTVMIPKNDTESNVIFWPPCTRVERCSGCCATDSLVCEPIRTELVSFQVVKYVMPYIGAVEFAYGGVQVVSIERHIACDQRCRIKATDCNPNIHNYLERDCRCRCKQRQSCTSSHHIWRENTCKCECAQRKVCGGFERFDESTCQCDLRQVIMGEMSPEEREKLRQILGEGSGASGESIQVAPPTTTTQAPTAAPTRPKTGPCPPMMCLPGWAPRRFGVNGDCNCMPSGFGFGGRRRRSARKHR